MKAVLHFLSGVALCFVVSAAVAQTWPAKPVRVVIPFPAGSGTDTIARPILNQVAKQLGQAVVVDNRPGGGGTIGMAAVANAEPDGYTVLVFSNSLTIVPATYPNLAFDPIRDLAGVTPLASLPMVLVVAPARGYRTVQDLIAAAKAHPGSLDYASAGAGGASHLGAERFRLAAGFKAGVHVPYKGAVEAVTDVMAGRVVYFTGPLAIALPQIKAGKLVALAMSSSKRSALLPDVPTTLEAGLADSDYNVWIGAWVPARTPRAIVERLNAEIAKAAQLPEVRQVLATAAAEPMVMSSEEFDTLLKREVAMNAALVRLTGVKVN